MKALKISESFMRIILEQAQKEYPGECCGMILGPDKNPDVLSRLRACVNVQDEHHQKDPENFTRTSETAFFIDPKELLQIQKENRVNGESIRVIYHSHINAGAYFSDEDIRIACQDGVPAYPGVQYLVVSVVDGKIKGCNLFYWDDQKGKFVS